MIRYEVERETGNNDIPPISLLFFLPSSPYIDPSSNIITPFSRIYPCFMDGFTALIFSQQILTVGLLSVAGLDIRIANNFVQCIIRGYRV